MRVWSGDKYGFLVVSHGNLLHAERDGIASLDGAYEILSWEDAHVVSVPQHTPPIETIRHPIRELLSEWARRQDERMHLARALKPNLERLSSLPHTIASMVVDVDNSRPIAAHVGGNVPQSVSEVAYAAERAIYKFVKATQTPTPGLEEVQSIAMTFPGFELVMAPITDTLALLVIADQNAAVSQIRIAAMSVAEDLRPFLSHSMQGRTTAIESA
jgi:predicted regulator of Ras-like GTPase activity (Roadblock/LC7/MglB family)